MRPLFIYNKLRFLSSSFCKRYVLTAWLLEKHNWFRLQKHHYRQVLILIFSKLSFPVAIFFLIVSVLDRNMSVVVLYNNNNNKSNRTPKIIRWHRFEGFVKNWRILYENDRIAVLVQWRLWKPCPINNLVCTNLVHQKIGASFSFCSQQLTFVLHGPFIWYNDFNGRFIFW